jgi:hypothetical protein
LYTAIDRKRHEQNQHGREDGPALARIAHEPAEGIRQRRRNEENGEHLQKIRQRRGILKGMCGVCVDETATVGAEFLDALLRCDRAHGQRLHMGRQRLLHGIAGGIVDGGALSIRLGLLIGERLDGRHIFVGAEILHHTLGHEGDREKCGDGQQNIERTTRHVRPKVADRGRTVTRKRADERDRHDDAGRCGQKVLHRKPGHLREIAHGGFAGIALPVRVGDKTHRRIECRVRRHIREMLRIERQP